MQNIPRFCSISRYMNENIDLKKYGADKIAFLAMFLIAIILAQVIVSINSVLDFSEPIELAHTGLSLSIPIGKNWYSTQQWIYEDNVFFLNANLVSGSSGRDAGVTCKYFFNSQKNITPQTSLELQIDDANNVVLETKLIEKDNLKIHWVRIDKPVTFFWAAAELPNNRAITIEVFETTFEIDIAERIFTKIIESLSFDEDNPVKTGAAFVEEIKDKGIDSLINNYNTQSCFFLQDSNNRNIGFTIDILGNLSGDRQFVVRGASYLLSAGLNYQEQRTLFRCDKGLNKFIWQSRAITRASRIGAMITLNESGTINVTNEFNGKSEIYMNCSNVIPGILLESFIGPLIQKKIDNLVIDIIGSEGKLSSILLSLKFPDTNTEDYSCVLTLKSFFSKESPEVYYLNDNNQIIKAAGNYYLERTEIDAIEKEFPSLKDYISQQLQLLNSNSL